MNTGQILSTLGFRVDNSARVDAAIRDFQRAWNLGAPLTIEGLVGPKTAAALNTSAGRLKSGLPTASTHFSFTEFSCKCGGRFAGCARIHILRAHIARLEILRSALNQSLSIVSGYRCPEYNHSIGGASNSQHMYGAATDIPGFLNSTQMLNMHLFAGLGYRQSDSHVVHVDSRDQSANNTTKSNVRNPAMWKYAE